MKTKLFPLSIFLLLTFSSCNEKITCILTTQNADAEFYENQTIYVNVEASTTKGSIIQVDILVDGEPHKSFSRPMPSAYRDTIQPRELPVGVYVLSAEAYSSDGNVEVSAIYLTIKEQE
jgi:hypothetical protein